MAFKFEALVIWQNAFALSNNVDLLIQSFPKRELFNLSSQMKRAADSIVLNISLRSAVEVVACLMMAKEKKYIDETQFKLLYDRYEILCRIITKFRNSLG